MDTSYSFLVVGETQESKDPGFARYVGIGTSKILAVNPSKEELDKIMGYEFPFTPTYVDERDGEKVANVYFVVQTDPELCNGIDIKTLLKFPLQAKPATYSNGEKVYVIDDFANYSKENYEDAKAHKPLAESHKIDHTNYRIACQGEVDLTVFLKRFLGIPESLDYSKDDNAWSLSSTCNKGKFRLEYIKNFFKGDFSEVKEAVALQPNNRIKLLYGVKTKEDGKTLQVVCSNANYILRNDAKSNVIAKAASDLAKAKANNVYQNIDYRVCELQKWDVKPTNLETPKTSEDPLESAGSNNNWDDWA